MSGCSCVGYSDVKDWAQELIWVPGKDFCDHPLAFLGELDDEQAVIMTWNIFVLHMKIKDRFTQ